jgi:glycine cleavage system H protein
METPPAIKTLHYKRSHFATQLPVDYRYLPSHSWVAPAGEGRWRVGLTKFATRMLGEMVDHALEIEPGAAVQCGQIIGWVEGFKAISDLYCVVEGRFISANTSLKENISRISKDPYSAGWLYEASGLADERAMDVYAYRELLDKAIDRILAEQKGKEIL